jgi:hypothetical protein
MYFYFPDTPRKISGGYLKHNVPLGFHLWEINHKRIHNRRHTVCVEPHANVTEIILDRQVETTSMVQGIQTKSETETSGEVQIAQHACEEDHQICWNAARTLQLELNSRYKKNKEAAHMACLEKIIGQSICDSHVSGSKISNIVSKQLHTYIHTYTHTHTHTHYFPPQSFGSCGMESQVTRHVSSKKKTEAKRKQLVESTGREKGFSI